MKTIEVPTRDQVNSDSQAIFDNLQQKLGMVPNLYAAIGHSSVALTAHLENSATLAKGAFNAREREAIYLATSQVNGCTYCQAAHTTIGKMNGFSEEDTIALRDLSHNDPKFSILSRLAANLTESRGRADSTLVQEFFANGYNEAALMDLIGLVTEISFTNYTHNLTQVAIDFPLAQPLEQAAV